MNAGLTDREIATIAAIPSQYMPAVLRFLRRCRDGVPVVLAEKRLHREAARIMYRPKLVYNDNVVAFQTARSLTTVTQN